MFLSLACDPVEPVEDGYIIYGCFAFATSIIGSLPRMCAHVETMIARADFRNADR